LAPVAQTTGLALLLPFGLSCLLKNGFWFKKVNQEFVTKKRCRKLQPKEFKNSASKALLFCPGVLKYKFNSFCDDNKADFVESISPC
jgi:hypothetical protein